MKGKLLLALTAGAMSALFAQQAAAQPECTIGTTGYTTIQNAVDDEECRTIILPAGTYMENVIIDRDVTIRGAGPQRTKVDAGGAYVSVFRIEGLNLALGLGAPCVVPGVVVNLEGMTITGGKGPPSDSLQRNGGGIGASPGVDLVVKNCIVTGNSAAQYGGGISVPNGRLTVIDSVISFNTAYVNTTPPLGYFGGGGGIRVTGCPSDLAIMDSVIEGNTSYAFGGGILSTVMSNAVTYGQGRLILKDVDIKRNAADEAGGGVFYDGVVFTTSDAKVKHNVPDDVQDGPPAP